MVDVGIAGDRSGRVQGSDASTQFLTFLAPENRKNFLLKKASDRWCAIDLTAKVFARGRRRENAAQGAKEGYRL
jgi:hypothetical protein